MDSSSLRCEGCNNFLISMEDVTIVCCDSCKNAYYYHEKCVSNEETYCYICDAELQYYNSVAENGEQVANQGGPIAEPIPNIIQNISPVPELEPESIPNAEAANNDFCNICGDVESSDSNPLITTSCKHVYHYDCLLDWFSNYKERECPYCRSKYATIALPNGKEYRYRFNMLDKELFKDVCMVDDCTYRGYPELGKLCFYHYEKNLVDDYKQKRDQHFNENSNVHEAAYRTCCGTLKNNTICTFQAKYIHNNKPYCKKHLPKDAANAGNASMINHTDKCTHVSNIGSHCPSKVTILSGYDKLCKEHYIFKINKLFDDVQLDEFNSKYSLLHVVKTQEAKKYCVGYRRNGKKCFIKVSDNVKYCCTRHNLAYFKPRWLMKQCLGYHPITHHGCMNPIYHENMLCILHSTSLDKEYELGMN